MFVIMISRRKRRQRQLTINDTDEVTIKLLYTLVNLWSNDMFTSIVATIVIIRDNDNMCKYEKSSSNDNTGHVQNPH